MQNVLRIVLIHVVAAVIAVGSPQGIAAQAPEALVRRAASTAQLAAQEYALGVEGGRVILAPEVEEARLFLAEAARMADQLGDAAGTEVATGFRDALALVNRTAPPEVVSARVEQLVARLATHYGVDVDGIPAAVLPLSRGSAIYNANCASCHGNQGRADGPAAAGLDPAPTALADANLLRDATPLDFYRRVTIGVAGTAMPSYEHRLTDEERWAVAVYASTLRLPRAAGVVPTDFSAFPASAKRSDAALLEALGPGATLALVASVRAASTTLVETPAAVRIAGALAQVRALAESSTAFAAAGQPLEARRAALDAYLAFEAVERDVRVRQPGVADRAEAAFAALRDRGPTAPADARAAIRAEVAAALELSERTLSAGDSPLSLFLQSLVILLREGLEAILIIGALLAFLTKTGAAGRKRDIHVGVGAAVLVSVVTALLIETVFHLSPARQEVLEGVTMAAATVMLFYVSYWLLTKVEVGKWNAFVKGQVQDALTSGSALALPSVAFLAVYREGFETVLFYKALFVTGGSVATMPILGGMLVGTVLLAVVYVAINRYGVRLPLKPFFAVTSTFLYYMAFVFAGKAVAELQGGGLVGTTPVDWAPRVPALGIFPTVQSLAAQGVLAGLALVAVAWIFWLEPARARRRGTASAAPVLEVRSGSDLAGA